MTKANVAASFAGPFAGGSGPALTGQQEQGHAALVARLTDSAPVVILRRRCCYCPTPHAMDGLGPILRGQIVSDGYCPTALALAMAQLDELEAGA